MNKAEIKEHIKRLENGRAATSDPHQIELIDLGLTKYRNMLRNISAQEQKKSDLEQTPASLKHTTNPSLGIPTLYPTAEKIEADAKQEEKRIEDQPRNQEQTARAFAPTIAAPTQAEDIFTIWQNRQGKGQIQVEYTLSELQAEMKRNFTLVFKSTEFSKKGNLMKMLLYCNLIPMYATITDAYVEVKASDLLSGYSQMKPETKVMGHKLLSAICACTKVMIEKPAVTPEQIAEQAKELAEITRRVIWG